jgi:hypothetical protein
MAKAGPALSVCCLTKRNINYMYQFRTFCSPVPFCLKRYMDFRGLGTKFQEECICLEEEVTGGWRLFHRKAIHHSCSGSLVEVGEIESAPAYTLLSEKLRGRWLFGKCRWLDNIKLDFNVKRMYGHGRDWSDSGHVQSLRSLLNTAMNFHVPKGGRTFFARSTTVGFSRRILLHGIFRVAYRGQVPVIVVVRIN